jgi:hypothetical protein
MTATSTNVTLHNMPTADPITVLVLQEFRLREADDAAAAARIVAASPTGIEPAIPLLTSIEDGRDVATLRALLRERRSRPTRSNAPVLVSSSRAGRRRSTTDRG